MEPIISQSVKFSCVLVSVSLLDKEAVTYAHTMTDCLGSGGIYPIMLSGCSSESVRLFGLKVIRYDGARVETLRRDRSKTLRKLAHLKSMFT